MYLFLDIKVIVSSFVLLVEPICEVFRIIGTENFGYSFLSSTSLCWMAIILKSASTIRLFLVTTQVMTKFCTTGSWRHRGTLHTPHVQSMARSPLWRRHWREVGWEEQPSGFMWLRGPRHATSVTSSPRTRSRSGSAQQVNAPRAGSFGTLCLYRSEFFKSTSTRDDDEINSINWLVWRKKTK